MVNKVVELDSQKKIHDSTFELRKGFLQKEADDTKKNPNETFMALNKKIEEYKAHLARVTRDWIAGDHTGDVYHAAVERISENSVNIIFLWIHNMIVGWNTKRPNLLRKPHACKTLRPSRKLSPKTQKPTSPLPNKFQICVSL